MSVGFLFILIVAILLVSWLTAGAKGGRLQSLRGSLSGCGLIVMLFLGLAFLGMVITWLASSADSPNAVHNALFPPPVVQWAYEGNLPEPVATNEQLWNRLTESRINLNEEPENAPPMPPKPKERPDWVSKPPNRVGDVYRAVAVSDPFSTVDECFEQLERRFPGEVEKRLTKLVPSDQRSHVRSKSLDAMDVTLDYIMREICREQFTESVESSVGEMKQVHVLMEFTPAVESHLKQSWQSYQREFRIALVAKIAALVLATLAVIYGLLQLDTWTRGYYTRRLLWGVPAAIIAIAVVFAVLFGV